jgi:hypothetical protein
MRISPQQGILINSFSEGLWHRVTLKKRKREKKREQKASTLTQGGDCACYLWLEFLAWSK